jgi:2-isopropylmalate synthase
MVNLAGDRRRQHVPTATVTLRDSNGVTHQDASIGDGPVDAIYSAIQRLTGVKMS